MSYFDDNEDRILRGSQGRFKSTKESVKPSLFNRGFNEVRQRVEKGSKYTKSCYNCEHYYQAVGDTTEVCQNPEVLKYDMVITETGIYCTKWEPLKSLPSNPNSSVRSLFRKR